MFNRKVAPYFFLGFVLAAYLKLPVIAIGGLGVIIALIVTQVTPKETEDNEDYTEVSTDETKTTPKLTKRDIRSLFFRSLTLEANFNFETWQNTGFAFTIIPVLKRLYTTKQTMAAALKRHLQFFNTSPYGSTLILGITAAMEEQNSQNKDFDEESINSIKLGLMGPLAGVFDSLFWGTFKVIAAGVGTSLAIKGNVMGPILFILIFNVPHLLLRYNLTFIGYNAGTKFLQNLAKNNVMDRLTKGASILGLMVVGAMPATLMSISTPLTIGTTKSAVAVQDILNQIVPAMIPLGLTFLVYYFVKKNVKTTYLLLGLLVLGFVGSMIHLFA
jgi:PTS system mannose-specific IID component